MSVLIQTKRFKSSIIISALVLFALFWTLFAPYKYSGVHRPSAFLNKFSTQHDVDWSKLAYVQYATDAECLCHSVMVFESLRRLGTKAQLLLMYPAQFQPDQDNEEGRLLKMAKDVYGARLS